MSAKHKILIIEDEKNIRNLVKTILKANGYQVFEATSGSTGTIMFNSHCPDLIILDLGLPDIDGIEFIKNIRQESQTPIIVLSARHKEGDKVSALDLGANDYVTKPFGMEELLARVRATLRNNLIKESGGDFRGVKFTVDNLAIDYDKRRVMIDNAEIHLTQTEYNIVEYLSIHAGRVLTYADIVKKIWGFSDSGSIKKLQVNMANIRKKLNERPGENRYITNELGVGYRMNSDDK
ncbi:MAG: response regulator transcription factor [Lachnospiraceae bacterium]|nr:response regulator transcription factor [Lachnospiraceae bacterium]